MSKVDAQRAMREAKYAARNSTGGPTRRESTAAGGTPKAPAATQGKTKPASAAAPSAAPQGAICGHKSMNGRECTREAGHPEKSHRYG
jgi:hypothetical protein